ncbi:MauE/DoxX family redox-associated membrane protein [Bacillus toyonensis]|uniref:MauE/DoxX family redox-associated membrane protein n=1 Tax=Bacillus toyonensis TaxID=155322 RepID=UPI002175858E|nr:MauE/DoxX family redox-associated membrane protein [Bacillus toyonensis]
MEYIHLYLRILCGVLLLSSGITHLYNKQKFISDIRNYKLLPSLFVRPLATTIVYTELLLGIILLSGYIQDIAYIATIMLFVIFNLSITLNLLRGNNKIDCGCGGIVGDNQISWKLVVRNFIFIIIIFYLFNDKGLYQDINTIILGQNNPSDINNYIILFSIIPTVLLSLTIFKVLEVRKKLMEF